MNVLTVLASNTSFTIDIPSEYSIRYLPRTHSFTDTAVYLVGEMRTALTNAREDLNRVHVGMARVPELLKTMLLLVKEAPYDTLTVLFPESFNTIDQLVNDSLTVLRKPEQSFKQVLNILIELELVTQVQHTLEKQIISLQVADLKLQWTLLTELMIELTKLAETTREHFLLQFNWVLKEFVRSGPNFPDALREFIVSLTKPKVIEIDRASDILGTITETYSDASSRFTDLDVSSYGNLFLLTNDTERRQYISQFQHELPTQAVNIARLALKKHKEFLEKDKYRQVGYENALASGLKTFTNTTSN